MSFIYMCISFYFYPKPHGPKRPQASEKKKPTYIRRVSHKMGRIAHTNGRSGIHKDRSKVSNQTTPHCQTHLEDT